MTKAQGAAVVALLLLVALLLAVDVALRVRHELDPPQWEYRVETFEDRAFVSSTNMLGSMGWELSSVRRVALGEGAQARGAYECIFRKPRARP